MEYHDRPNIVNSWQNISHFGTKSIVLSMIGSYPSVLWRTESVQAAQQSCDISFIIWTCIAWVEIPLKFCVNLVQKVLSALGRNWLGKQSPVSLPSFSKDKRIEKRALDFTNT